MLSVPKPLRLRLARDPAWTSWVGGLVVRAIAAWQRRTARARGVPTPLTGAIMFVRRFGGLVNLNVHFHLVVPDGVFKDLAVDPPADLSVECCERRISGDGDASSSVDRSAEVANEVRYIVQRL